jgi:hypothetical protein
MGKIIEAQDIPEGEKVYLKKDVFGWRTIQPIKINGKINWLNFLLGGTRNALGLIILLLLIGFLMFSHYHDVEVIQKKYADISADPIAWCKNVNANPAAYQEYKPINLTGFKLLNE